MFNLSEIQKKTLGRKFESSHSDQIYSANETPKFLAKFMVELAEINETSKVLEPSAGIGNIAEEIREKTSNIQCVELNSNNVDVLKKKNFNVLHADFLNVWPLELEIFDAVLMCPPKNSIAHVEHALEFVKMDGILIALVREDSFYLEKYRNLYIPLDIKFQMDGNNVPSGLLVM